jgi:hypothetical protein
VLLLLLLLTGRAWKLALRWHPAAALLPPLVLDPSDAAPWPWPWPWP